MKIIPLSRPIKIWHGECAVARLCIGWQRTSLSSGVLYYADKASTCTEVKKKREKAWLRFFMNVVKQCHKPPISWWFRQTIDAKIGDGGSHFFFDQHWYITVWGLLHGLTSSKCVGQNMRPSIMISVETHEHPEPQSTVHGCWSQLKLRLATVMSGSYGNELWSRCPLDVWVGKAKLLLRWHHRTNWNTPSGPEDMGWIFGVPHIIQDHDLAKNPPLVTGDLP